MSLVDSLQFGHCLFGLSTRDFAVDESFQAQRRSGKKWNFEACLS